MAQKSRASSTTSPKRTETPAAGNDRPPAGTPEPGGRPNGGKEPCIALVLGGGAPNLTMMAGAVAALDEAGVKFDLVSTSGAGMLIGLLYAAPKGRGRQEALRDSVNMGVHDAIYDLFPVNYKVFHKPGPAAVAYTRFWQMAARQMREWETMWRDSYQALAGINAPGPLGDVFRSMFGSMGAMPVAGFSDHADAKRFLEDLAAFFVAAACPSDLNPTSQGMCQWAPFVDEVVDFQKLKDFPAEFYLSAYCLEDGEMVMFPKEQISLDHFQAALSFPLIYAPFKLDGKTYIEGATVDTLNFQGLQSYRERRQEELKAAREQKERHDQQQQLREALSKISPMFGALPAALLAKESIDSELEHVRKPLTAIVVCDILGTNKLISEPRGLYDAWVKSIIAPLTAVAEDDINIFEHQHLGKLGDPPGSTALLKIQFDEEMPPDHWPKVLDWSYSNLKTLFDVGYRAGKRFAEEHPVELGLQHTAKAAE